AGVALPPGAWSLIFATTAFAITSFQFHVSSFKSGSQGRVPFAGNSKLETGNSKLHLFHLPVFDVDRRRAAEDRDDHTHRSLLRVDLVDQAFEVFERPFAHLYLVALLKAQIRQGRRVLGLDRRGEHFLNIYRRHGRGLAAGADEIADA